MRYGSKVSSLRTHRQSSSQYFHLKKSPQTELKIQKLRVYEQEVVDTQMRITIMSELQEMKILLCCLHFILKLELKAIAFMG